MDCPYKYTCRFLCVCIFFNMQIGLCLLYILTSIHLHFTFWECQIHVYTRRLGIQLEDVYRPHKLLFTHHVASAGQVVFQKVHEGQTGPPSDIYRLALWVSSPCGLRTEQGAGLVFRQRSQLEHCPIARDHLFLL